MVDRAASAGDPTDSCRCGCGEAVRAGSRYHPGHDARHAAAVGRYLISLDRVDDDALAVLPSPALRAKATAMLERARATRGRVHATPLTAPTPALASAQPSAPSPLPRHTRDPSTTEITPGPSDATKLRHPGHSTEQQDAEAVMRDTLAATLGIDLRPARIHLPSGARVDVDAVSDDPPVLAELWAHQGPPKGAQSKKVLADALKLHHLAGHLALGHRLILGLADNAAAHNFTTARTWYADALRTLHIEVVVIDLPDDLRELVRAAQQRQRR